MLTHFSKRIFKPMHDTGINLVKSQLILNCINLLSNYTPVSDRRLQSSHVKRLFIFLQFTIDENNSNMILSIKENCFST